MAIGADRVAAEVVGLAELVERLLGVPPAVAARLDDAEHEREQPAEDRSTPDPVEGRLLLGVEALVDQERADEQDRHDEDVDPEAPAPAVVRW